MKNRLAVGSLVIALSLTVWVREVGGSNPLAPTIDHTVGHSYVPCDLNKKNIHRLDHTAPKASAPESESQVLAHR